MIQIEEVGKIFDQFRSWRPGECKLPKQMHEMLEQLPDCSTSPVDGCLFTAPWHFVLLTRQLLSCRGRRRASFSITLLIRWFLVPFVSLTSW
ncbi:hypothetical protein FHG87_000061 [Trinorchestia longiramus]|nr:hypothetical protein FHG87_000061 [Trinorchestia longiramus]